MRSNVVAKSGKTKRGGWWKVGYGLWLTLNIIVAIGLICSAYAGELNPARVAGAGIVGMTLPGWFAVALFLTVMNLIWWHRTSLLLIVSLIVCAGPLWNFCPLNLPPGRLDAQEQERAFTLLTYNTLGMVDQEQPGSSPNRTLEYILEQDADIVCAQELYMINESEVLGVTGEQIEALHRRYPYIIFSKSQAVLSKYPVSALHVDYYAPDTNGGDFAAYRIDIDGHQVSVFNCHFQSIGLTPGGQEAVYPHHRRTGRTRQCGRG